MPSPIKAMGSGLAKLAVLTLVVALSFPAGVVTASVLPVSDYSHDLVSVGVSVLLVVFVVLPGLEWLYRRRLK